MYWSRAFDLVYLDVHGWRRNAWTAPLAWIPGCSMLAEDSKPPELGLLEAFSSSHMAPDCGRLVGFQA